MKAAQPSTIEAHPVSFTFTIPIMPPSVNHYTEHPATGVHFKSAAAKAFEIDFGSLAPPAHYYVKSQSGKFSVWLEFWPGPKGRGDVDNYNKQPLDCCAARGYFRDKKGDRVSDAWVKELRVTLHDTPEDRKIGPQMRITIEAI